jgi:8-oxo-dGTP pyrophosphatase MutT (NUDIX family)
MLYEVGAKTIVRAVIPGPNDWVLLLRRTKNHNLNPDMWEAPGGKLDPPELAKATKNGVEREVLVGALERENSEETGLPILSIGGFNRVERRFLDNDRNKGLVICHAALVIVGEGEVVLDPEEHYEFRWQNPARLTPDITPATFNALGMYNKYGFGPPLLKGQPVKAC